MVEDGRYWASGVAANFFGSFFAAVAQRLFYAFNQLRRVGGRHVQVDDALDGQGQTEDQTNQYERHERCTALDEVLLHGLVEAQDLAGLFNGFFSGNGWSHSG